MRDYQSFEVRNVSVIGHSGAGNKCSRSYVILYKGQQIVLVKQQKEVQ